VSRAPLISFVVVVGLLTVGCEETEPSAATAPAVPTAVSVAAVPVLSTAPADQVGSCVESTKFGAHVGDAEAQQRWDSVGQSDNALRSHCEEIGLDDPGALEAMHVEWVATQQQMAESPASAASSEAAAAPAATEPAPAPPVRLAEIPEPAEVAQPELPAPVEVASTNCDPSYPDMCLPIGAPDLDCGDVPNRQFTVLSPDPHGFDRDDDGVGCESE
jgi:hypothetical protein